MLPLGGVAFVSARCLLLSTVGFLFAKASGGFLNDVVKSRTKLEQLSFEDISVFLNFLHTHTY